MKVVIVGDGKVGSNVAAELSSEGNDVIVIDRDSTVLTNSVNTMDIIGVEGNGASAAVQRKAGVPDADLLIAATSADEVNMLACLLGKKLGASHTIARVRNPEYFSQIGLLKEELGMSMAVNPEYAAAAEISRLLRFPSALKIEVFAKGRVELVEIKIPEGSPLDGMPLYAISSEFQARVLICAVQRQGEVFIPDGGFILREGDKINVTATHGEILNFFRALGIFRNGVRSVMIIGGSRIAYYLAKELTDLHVRVKIIESDLKRCEYLCEVLPAAVIIHGDGADKELLQEEGLEKTDALVMLTGMDEENIVVSLYAKAKKVSKVIAKINRIAFDEILDTLDIDSIISPKDIAAHHIVRYVRAMENTMGSSVETLHRFINNRVEALEFRVREESPVIGVPLKDLETKSELLIAAIIRGNQVIVPCGEDTMNLGDSVVIVAKNQQLTDLKDIVKER